MIANGEFVNRHKIFDNMRGNKGILEIQRTGRKRKHGVIEREDRHERPFANHNMLGMVGEGGKGTCEVTEIGGEMSGRSRIHEPVGGGRLLQSHGIHGVDKEHHEGTPRMHAVWARWAEESHWEAVGKECQEQSA